MLIRYVMCPAGSSFCFCDVDTGELEEALKIAYKAHAKCERIIFFLLHTADYFDYSEEFGRKVLEFQALGHEVGILNNFVTQFLFNNKGMGLLPIISKPLQFMQDIGVIVKGTSSYPDERCFEHGYQNYQCWTECPWGFSADEKQWLEMPNFPRITMQAFGLEYEAYFLQGTRQA